MTNADVICVQELIPEEEEEGLEAEVEWRNGGCSHRKMPPQKILS